MFWFLYLNLIALIFALLLEVGFTGIEYLRGSPNPFITANMPFEMQYTDTFKYTKDWDLEKHVNQYELRQGSVTIRMTGVFR